jgi:uncharacterized membrane protein YdjX (TVP38/TMEM64 family)
MSRKDGRNGTPMIRKITLLCLGLTVAAAVLFYIFLTYNPTHLVYNYLESDANFLIFAVLMALLPLAGMPISIFLVLAGILYGMPGAIALTAGVMFFHLLMTYYLVHSLVRPLLVRLLDRFDLAIPKFPARGRKRIGFVFMILPGIPYSAKNYLLALAEMPFRPYLLIGWTAQFGLSIPFIILGKGVIRMDPVILLAAVCLLGAGFILQNYLRKKYKKLDESV